MGYHEDRKRKRKTDLVIKGLMAGEGPVEEELPVATTIVKKCVYEVRPECESGIPTLLTIVLKDNRELCVKGKLTNALLKIIIQNGEETPVVTIITDAEFRVCLKLKKNDKIAFAFEAGDNFLVDFKAFLQKRRCRCSCECKC